MGDQPAEEPDEDAGDQAGDEVLVAVEATGLRAELGVLEQRCGGGHCLRLPTSHRVRTTGLMTVEAPSALEPAGELGWR